MKKLVAGVLMTVFALGLGFHFVWASVHLNYEYNRDIGGYWSLSEKASTLDLKADYLNKFVAAVNAAGLTGYDAVFFQTPDNSVEQNMIAVQSLQIRMGEIRDLNPRSFEYQQAIYQITQQEQGEAEHLLGTIEGRWYLQYHPLFWDWIGVLYFLSILTMLITGVISTLMGFDDAY